MWYHTVPANFGSATLMYGKATLIHGVGISNGEAALIRMKKATLSLISYGFIREKATLIYGTATLFFGNATLLFGNVTLCFLEKPRYFSKIRTSDKALSTLTFICYLRVAVSAIRL